MPVPHLADTVSRLRREHAQFFEQAARRAARGTAVGRRDVRVALGIAFGALAYLPEWYDPTGAIGVDEFADRMADGLLRPFDVPSAAATARRKP